MSSNAKEDFEKCWGKFITQLKGRLMTVSKNQKLSYNIAKLQLTDIAANWDSEYEETGRWLRQYCKENPEKGQLVREVLLEHMCFIEIQPKKDYSEVMNYVIPVAGALAGFGISTLAHARTVVRAISTVAPTVLLYPSAKAVGTTLHQNSKTELLDEYIFQLDKYHQCVISILSE